MPDCSSAQPRSARITDLSKSATLNWNRLRIDPSGFRGKTDGDLELQWRASDFSDISGEGRVAIATRVLRNVDCRQSRRARRARRCPEGAVEVVASGAFWDRLLPHLREIASARLERTGRTPGPDTLGQWWDLLRPDRPEPTDRFARGIREADLRALVADLERL